MATFQQTGPVELQTSLPNVQTVTPKMDTTAGTIAAVGDAAIRGFDTYKRFQAKDAAQGVLDQFNQDLQDAQDAGNLAQFLQANIQEMAKDNPNLSEYASKIGSFDTAAKQRKGAALLLQLRGEAEMKKVLRTAPGMRAEIASITKNTLGFDPTGATIDAILKGIEGEGKDTGWTFLEKELYKEATSLGVQPALTPEGRVDVPKTQIQNAKIYQKKEQLQQLDTQLENNEISEQDYITQYSQLYTQQLDQRVSNLKDTTRNYLVNIKNFDDLVTFREQIYPQLSALESQLSQRIDTDFANLPVSGKGIEALRKSRDDIKTNMTSGIRLILDSKDMNEFQTRKDMYDVLVNDLKFSFADSNRVLTSLTTTMPGAVQPLVQSVLTGNIAARKLLESYVVRGATSMTEDDLRRTDFSNMLQIMADRRAFDGKSLEEKRALTKPLFKVMSNFVKSYEENSNSITDMDIEGVTNAYASVLQLGEQMTPSDMDQVAKLTSHPSFLKIVERMKQRGGDSTTKAHILADSGVASTKQYIANNLMGKLKEMQDLGGKMAFNAETGKIGTAADPSSATWANRNIFGTLQFRKGDELKQLERDMNAAVDTLYNLREYDPSLANLDKAQIAYSLVGQDLRANGVKIYGKMKDFPVNETEEATEFDSDSAFTELARRIEDLRLNTQDQSVADQFKSITDELERMRKQNADLRRAKGALK